MIRKRYALVLAMVFCLVATLFVITSVGYDPWVDHDEDGDVDSNDLYVLAQEYGSSGDPTKNVTVTNFPLDGQGNIKVSSQSVLVFSVDVYQQLNIDAWSVVWHKAKRRLLIVGKDWNTSKGVIYKTDDLGKTFTKVEETSGTLGTVQPTAFISSSEFVVAYFSAQGLFYSDDGGNTWSIGDLPTATDSWFFCEYNNKDIYAASHGGAVGFKVYKSSDGATWILVKDLGSYDDHAHFIAYNQYTDKFIIPTGDTNDYVLECSTDFSTITQQAIDKGDGTPLQMCPVLILDGKMLLGSDAGIREFLTMIKEDFTFVTFIGLRKGMAGYFGTFSLINAGGLLVAGTRGGVIAVSNDSGWSWAQMEIGEEVPWMHSITSSQGFVFVAAKKKLVIFSKEFLTNLPLTTGEYCLGINRAPNTSWMSQSLDLKNWKEIYQLVKCSDTGFMLKTHWSPLWESLQIAPQYPSAGNTLYDRTSELAGDYHIKVEVQGGDGAKKISIWILTKAF